MLFIQNAKEQKEVSYMKKNESVRISAELRDDIIELLNSCIYSGKLKSFETATAVTLVRRLKECSADDKYHGSIYIDLSVIAKLLPFLFGMIADEKVNQITQTVKKLCN